jgi:hypothetical protein
MVLGLLAELRAGGYTLEAVMEPSGTYGDVLRYQLLEAGIPVFRVSGKRTHDAREVYDGGPIRLAGVFESRAEFPTKGIQARLVSGKMKFTG